MDLEIDNRVTSLDDKEHPDDNNNSSSNAPAADDRDNDDVTRRRQDNIYEAVDDRRHSNDDGDDDDDERRRGDSDEVDQRQRNDDSDDDEEHHPRAASYDLTPNTGEDQTYEYLAEDEQYEQQQQQHSDEEDDDNDERRRQFDDNRSSSPEVDRQTGSGADAAETADAFGQTLYDDTALHQTNYERIIGGPEDLPDTSLYTLTGGELESPRSPVRSPSPVYASPVRSVYVEPTAVPQPAAAAAPQKESAGGPGIGPSGKFVLRSSRQAGATHFIDAIRQVASTSDNAEKQEMITVLRSTIKNVEENKMADRKSVVKTTFVQAYENQIISTLPGPVSPPMPTQVGYVAPARRPTPAVTSPPALKVVAESPMIAVREEETEDRNEPEVTSPSSLAINGEPARLMTSEPAGSRDIVTEVKSPVASDPPIWLNTAIDKQKRSAQNIQEMGSIRAKKPPTAVQSAGTGSVPPPWVKDRIVKKQISLTTAAAADPVPVTMAVPHEAPAVAATAAAYPAAAVVDVVDSKQPDQQPTTPTWKAEVETRKKSKAYVTAQKPEQPLRLGTVPDWKKQLQEKAKTKRGQSVDGSDDGPLPSPGPASAGLSPLSPTWKLELAQLKKLASPDEDSNTVPEWLRIAEEKQKSGVPASPGVNGVK